MIKKRILRIIAKHVCETQPHHFEIFSMQFLKRHNGEYLVSILDYDMQARLRSDGSLLSKICKPTVNEVEQTLTELWAG